MALAVERAIEPRGFIEILGLRVPTWGLFLRSSLVRRPCPWEVRGRRDSVTANELASVVEITDALVSLRTAFLTLSSLHKAAQVRKGRTMSV